MSTLTPVRAHHAAMPEIEEHLADTPCRSYDADLWFADTPEGVATAQRLCGYCPLRPECLQGALDRSEPWGVWGGELFERGAPVARKRRPGRPRKDDEVLAERAEQALAERLDERVAAPATGEPGHLTPTQADTTRGSTQDGVAA